MSKCVVLICFNELLMLMLHDWQTGIWAGA